MRNVSYDQGNMRISIVGMDEVSTALGDLRRKTPAVAKVAINATARRARKLMIAQAKARYAVNAAGQRHLKELVQRKKASNKNLSAELHISSFRNDLGYFKTSPKRPYIGKDVANAPSFFKGHVLKSSGMKTLSGGRGLSKGFLLPFKSGHIGMVQRVIGSRSSNTRTVRSGAPRWRNAQGHVEKLKTMGSPSATAMHNTIWPDVEPDVELYLQQRLQEQITKVMARAKARKR